MLSITFPLFNQCMLFSFISSINLGSGASSCMKKFDTGFRQCVTTIGADPDNFFRMLADQPLAAGVNKDALKQSTCRFVSRVHSSVSLMCTYIML